MNDETKDKDAEDTRLWSTQSVGELLKRLGYETEREAKTEKSENKDMLPGLEQGVELAKDINRTSGGTGVFAFVLLVILALVGWKIMEDFEDAVAKLATHQSAMMQMLKDQEREIRLLSRDVELLLSPNERRRTDRSRTEEDRYVAPR